MHPPISKSILLALFIGTGFFSILSCSVHRKAVGHGQDSLLGTGDWQSAHVGISVFDETANARLFDYQGDKYFVPASNTKLFSCYAAMKYLGDSILGLRYEETTGGLIISGTGDPSFLHPDFVSQPVFDFLKKHSQISYFDDFLLTQFTPWGSGWSWDDFQEDYMAERSEFPIYGNCAIFYLKGDTVAVAPNYFYNDAMSWLNQTLLKTHDLHFRMERKWAENFYHAIHLPSMHIAFSRQIIPFRVNEDPHLHPAFIALLSDTLGKSINISLQTDRRTPLTRKLYSRPVDSLLRPMMNHSDNFFAEQTLLMVSAERLGFMNDEKIIDTLLKTDLKDLPQKPVWSDGSGLSRYNLFSPRDFVWLLKRIKDEFGLEKIKGILPTGGQGTLGSRYKQDSGYLFAKTGSLSGVIALSGYLITTSNHLLIFSILVNNYHGDGSQVRDAMGRFVDNLRLKY
jgi:D-alanyl-D-alanine carboxypeptidase/D-alanyl-D-alanine-endopeptidase (penicillin-binding protein 4)